MPSAQQIAARKQAALDRMEQIKGMLLAHGWRFQGVTEGYEDTFVRRHGPDTPDNQVTRLVGAGQMKFRRGEQYARVGYVWSKFWRFDGTRSQDRAQIKNTAVVEIQALLNERSPRRE